jgi:hypoxanthine phosphoribosyltransferase
MDEIRGILFAVIKRKGTKSEGPEYYIKPIDDYKNRWSEILVRKKTNLWENDLELHEFLDKKVLIIGEIIETKSTITVDYSQVKQIE